MNKRFAAAALCAAIAQARLRGSGMCPLACATGGRCGTNALWTMEVPCSMMLPRSHFLVACSGFSATPRPGQQMKYARRTAHARPPPLRTAMPSSTPQLNGAAEEDSCARRNEILAHLIARARAGDVSGFEQLHGVTRNWLLGRIRRTVQDGQAEDVLAEVYFKVWRNLGSYDPSRSPPTVWLAVIARSVSLDHLRKESSRSHAIHLILEPPGLPEASHADGPEQRLSRSQDSALVRLVMARLSAKERMVICRAYFLECTQQEISARTGLPLGTVKALARSAQAKLRSFTRP